MAIAGKQVPALKGNEDGFESRIAFIMAS